MSFASTLAVRFGAGLLALAIILLARAGAASLLRVPNRLPPFGEPRPSSLANAGLGRRIAIALAGLVAAHAFVTALCVLGLIVGGEVEPPGAPVVDVVPSMPAAAAGMQDGDRIVVVAGTPIEKFASVRERIDARPDGPVAIEVERQGRRLRFAVFPEQGKVGVRLRMGRMSAGQALRGGVRMPLSTWANFAEYVFQPRPTVQLSGPVAIVRATAERGPLSGSGLAALGTMLSLTTMPFLLAVSLALLVGGPRARERDLDEPAAASLDGGRPWTRLLARTIDLGPIYLLLVVLGELSAIAPMALGVIFVPLIEALLLSTWGTTPGKWLLGLVVRTTSGGKLSFRQALHRWGAVTLFGLGAGLDFGLVSGSVAKRRLRRTGATYWDQLGGFRVSHQPIGVGRAVLLCLGLVLAAVVLVRSIGLLELLA